jgi:hypothetical protein
MKNKILILLLVILQSCSTKTSNCNINALNEELLNFVSEYINEVDFQIDSIAATPYYSLFFYNKNSQNYLTIWASHYYPTTRGVFNDTLKYKSYLYAIALNRLNSEENIKRYLTIFDYGKGHGLFDTTYVDLSLKSDLRNVNPQMRYDGPYYARTYMFSKKNGKYKFVLCNKLFAEPLDSNFINYERLQQYQALKKFSKLVVEYENFKAENNTDSLTLSELEHEVIIAKWYMNKIGNSLLP